MSFEAANLRLSLAGLEGDGVPDLARPAGPGAGHDRAEAVLREGAVDEEAGGAAVVLAIRGFANETLEGRPDLVDPFARLGARGEDGHVGEGAAGEGVAHVFAGELEHLVVDEVELRQHDEATVDAEQLADREVLASLGHDAFVRCDDEHHEVETRGAGDHRPHELLVPGHVDDRDLEVVRERERCETELDRDAARLLFREAIEVATGQCMNEGGLAVVDVAGGAEDEALDRRFVFLGFSHARAQRGPIRSVPT